MNIQNIATESLAEALFNLDDNASKSDLTVKIASLLLKSLGFTDEEIRVRYPTGNGKEIADFVGFKASQPFLILHLAATATNFNLLSPQYKLIVDKLTKDLLSPNCKPIQWGIITNGKQIQLFRKHGKVVYPYGSIQLLDASQKDNLGNVIDAIKNNIEHTHSALTVAIYNNKGGVGKTTTTINLAAILTLLKYKVLAIDFDSNQQDLTKSLGLKSASVGLYDCLEAKDNIIKQAIVTYQQKVGKKGNVYNFDVLPSDEKFSDEIDSILRQKLTIIKLSKILEPLRYEYDYILIDTPPNWRFFSQSSLYAADAVLMPAQCNNINSLENAATVIKNYLYQIYEFRKYNKPIALPIFFNGGGKISEAQLKLVHKTIDNIIQKSWQEKFNLLSYFYPQANKTKMIRDIFTIEESAHIAKGNFLHIPAVYSYKIAYEAYQKLAKEYFIQ